MTNLHEVQMNRNEFNAVGVPCERQGRKIPFIRSFKLFGRYRRNLVNSTSKGKGKAVPLQARSGPEGPRKLRFPDFVTTAQGGSKVVSLTHRPPLPPGNTPGTHFC